MGVPTGQSYPKMVTATGPGGSTVPAVYPAGNAKQFMFVILANAAEEAAYTGNGIPITAVAGPTPSNGNGWGSGGWTKKDK